MWMVGGGEGRDRVGDSIYAAARRFVELGYNVIFVDQRKTPVGLSKYDECYRGRRITLDEINTIWREYKRRITGLALLGVVNPEYPNYHLIIIDIDNPEVWKREVAPKLTDTLRNLLAQTWWWMTGPRCPKCGDKHNIKCVEGRCKHEDCGTEFRLDNSPRGLAFAVLVPKPCIFLREGVKKLKGGAIEIRYRGYELIPPSLHPSGAQYEWIIEPVDKPVALSCEEWRKLLEAVGYFTEKTVEETSPAGLKRTCKRIRSLTDEQIRSALEIIKQVYVPMHRDHVLFGIVGWLWHKCVDYDSARKLVEWLTEWATEKYSDEDPKHNFYILDWVYGRAGSKSETRHVWGRPKLLEAIQNVFEDPQYYGMRSEEARVRALEIINELEKIFGFKYSKKLVAIIIESKYRGNRIEWVVNDPGKGIIISAKRWEKKEVEKCLKTLCKEQCSHLKNSNEGNNKDGSDDEYEKCVEECMKNNQNVKKCVDDVASWGFKWIGHFYFAKVRRYVDKITHDTYYSVVIVRPRISKKLVLRYVKLGDLVDYMKDRGIVDSSRARDALAAILSMWPTRTVYDYVTLGVVPDDEGKPRMVFYSPLGRYFRKYYDEVSEDLAKETYRLLIEFIRKWYGDNPKVWHAIAVGLFQGLNFYRKCQGLRNKLLLLAGEPETGKSTIAKMILMMYGLYRKEIIIKVRKGAATVFSPARLARAVVLTTFPVLIDEGKTFADRQEVAELIKNLTDNLTIYETAKAYTMTTVQYPAYAGLILTTQYVHITDPGVQARFDILWFTTSEKKRKELQGEFNRELESIEERLGYIGAWYVKYLINNWQHVKHIILHGDPIKAALEYFKHLLHSLGIEPPEMEVEEDVSEAEYVDELERLRHELFNLIEPIALQLQRNNDITFEEAVRRVLESKYLVGHGLKYFLHDDTIGIFTELIHRLRLGSLRNIYEKIKNVCPSAKYVKTGGKYVLRINIEEFVKWLLREVETES